MFPRIFSVKAPPPFWEMLRCRTGINAAAFLCNAYLEVRRKGVKDPSVSGP